jgi:hypothetical protein
VAPDFGGDGIQGGAQVIDLAGEPGERVRFACAGTVLFDDGAQLRSPVEGGAANVCVVGDGVESDRAAGLGELGAGSFDAGETVVIGHDA